MKRRLTFLTLAAALCLSMTACRREPREKTIVVPVPVAPHHPHR